MLMFGGLTRVNSFRPGVPSLWLPLSLWLWMATSGTGEPWAVARSLNVTEVSP